MKDAKGHGSSKRGSRYNDMAAAVAHQSATNAAVPQTPEAHILGGGKIPTEDQYASYQSRHEGYMRGWLGNHQSFDEAYAEATPFGKDAMTRIRDDMARSQAAHAKFGTEENPTELTKSLRAGKK